MPKAVNFFSLDFWGCNSFLFRFSTAIEVSHLSEKANGKIDVQILVNSTLLTILPTILRKWINPEIVDSFRATSRIDQKGIENLFSFFTRIFVSDLFFIYLYFYWLLPEMCTVFNLEANWFQLYHGAHEVADIIK